MITTFEEEDWWAPGEVIPTVSQLEMFVLPSIDELRNGDWPPDPRPTGYADYRKTRTNKQAHFIHAAELAAEVDERMDRITDSIALILYYTAGWELHKIAKALHYYDELDLWHEMRLMLKYVAGRKRKATTYPRWKAIRKTGQNDVKNTSKDLHKKINNSATLSVMTG